MEVVGDEGKEGRGVAAPLPQDHSSVAQKNTDLPPQGVCGFYVNGSRQEVIDIEVFKDG